MYTAFISQLISDTIFFISDKAEKFSQYLNIAEYSTFQIFLDIFLVALVFYWCIQIVRGTRAVQVLIGFLIIGFLYLLSTVFNLLALEWLLVKLFTVFLVAIPIIFQQELRRGLEKLGQTKFKFNRHKQRKESLIKSLQNAVLYLAENKIGALIVLKSRDSLSDIIDTGVLIDAQISKELITTIFHPKTALHDGAIIIENDRIKAAGCVLPLTFKKYGHEFGVRHKAALALSEVSDAHIIVISEEKGRISYVHNQKLIKNITLKTLNIILKSHYLPDKKHT